MCSVATTFRKRLSLFVKHNKLEDLFPPGVNDGIGGRNAYPKILLEDMKKDKEPAEQNFRRFWEDEVLQNFIRSAYTFANLIIVPDGFNFARYTRGESGTEDYWDLTLKKFYQDKEPFDYTD